MTRLILMGISLLGGILVFPSFAFPISGFLVSFLIIFVINRSLEDENEAIPRGLILLMIVIVTSTSLGFLQIPWVIVGVTMIASIVGLSVGAFCAAVSAARRKALAES